MPSKSGSSKGKAWDDLRLKVLNRDGWTCSYCGKHLEGKDAQADHVIPRHNNGPDEEWNLVAACGSCNGSKSDRVLVRMPYVNKDWIDSI